MSNSYSAPRRRSSVATIDRFMNALRAVLPHLRERYSVRSLAVLGSYARHEQSRSSDLDIWVEFEEAPGLPKFIEMENYLSDLLGVQVDLVMKDALKPHIGERILDKAIAV